MFQQWCRMQQNKSYNLFKGSGNSAETPKKLEFMTFRYAAV